MVLHSPPLDLLSDRVHTGNVAAMNTQTLTTLLGMAGFVMALLGYLATMKRDLKADTAALKADTAALEHRLGSRVTEVRDDVRSGFTAVDRRLAVLEQRTYDLKPDVS